ncbi:MAG TPA: hypothetical protein VJ742_12735 [Nitrososphaera sp.]|nr:hypothetical protein [Nitrososphaera sp.]
MADNIKPIGLQLENRFYDPPSELTFGEAQSIGAALRLKLSQELQQYRNLKKAFEERKDEYPPEMVEAALKRELSFAKNTWRLMCRFLTEPLPWEFFEKIHEVNVQA